VLSSLQCGVDALLRRAESAKDVWNGNRVRGRGASFVSLMISCNYMVARPRRSWPSGHLSISSYLVDPASSHMLVSKIKPCMSKYKLLYSETANGSLNQL